MIPLWWTTFYKIDLPNAFAVIMTTLLEYSATYHGFSDNGVSGNHGSQIMQLAPIEVYYSRVIENIYITTIWGQRQFFVQLDH